MASMSESEAALIGKALGDLTRLGIYTQIARHKELFCGELEACQLISGATISHHLRVLTQSGLITSRRSGQHIFYRAIPRRLNDYRRYLANFRRPSPAAKKPQA
jgi:ArsR family transcriptional regulator